MQLVAYGAQDIYLTGNPQITFFKVVYRRHTNFSIEAIQQTLNGNPTSTGSNIQATIARNGDLVSNLWVEVELVMTNPPTLVAPVPVEDVRVGTYLNWTNNTGHAFIKDCEIEIGGQRIDRQYSEWLDVWNELTDHDNSEWIGLNKHASKISYLRSSASADSDSRTDLAPNIKLYIPLKFWFCNNPGLALPLIALQYHEVKIKFTTRHLLALINTDNKVFNNPAGFAEPVVNDPIFKLWADYIYLDTDERRRFAQVSHEYLIEQVQRTTGSVSDARVNQKLNFNHPVKELIWVFRNTEPGKENITPVGGEDSVDTTDNKDGAINGLNANNDYFCYAFGMLFGDDISSAAERLNGKQSQEGFGTFALELNGHDRFSSRNASYFRTCHPLQVGHKVPSKHIYCYSFSLKPEEHQPSGTCNFSRIDSAKMKFTGVQNEENATVDLIVFAVNYNVLRIMSGMGGLAYSN